MASPLFGVLGVVLAAVGADAATIRLATNPWPPIQGPSMSDGGPSVALVRAAAKAVGHSVEVTFVPWQRAKEMARSGERDGLLAAWYTEARAERYVYTQPYYSMRVGLIAHRDLGIQRYETLDQLRTHPIGVLKGWGYPESFRTASGLTKRTYSDPPAAAASLFRGEVEIVAMAESVFIRHAAESAEGGAEAYRMLHPPLMKPDLHVALNRDVPDARGLAEELDRGLRRIKANGTYAEILERYRSMRQLSEQ